MDTGRSRMLASALPRQSLACMRCGACLNAGPVYRQIGGHAYGSVYPGPIGAIVTPQLFGLAQSSALPYASSLCGACRDVCPVKIDIPAVLLHLRAQVVERRAGSGGALERLAFSAYAAVVARPRLFEWLGGGVRGPRVPPPPRRGGQWRGPSPPAPHRFFAPWA